VAVALGRVVAGGKCQEVLGTGELSGRGPRGEAADTPQGERARTCRARLEAPWPRAGPSAVARARSSRRRRRQLRNLAREATPKASQRERK
jgi:hypothetical protein